MAGEARDNKTVTLIDDHYLMNLFNLMTLFSNYHTPSYNKINYLPPPPTYQKVFMEEALVVAAIPALVVQFCQGVSALCHALKRREALLYEAAGVAAPGKAAGQCPAAPVTHGRRLLLDRALALVDVRAQCVERARVCAAVFYRIYVLFNKYSKLESLMIFSFITLSHRLRGCSLGGLCGKL